MTQTTWKTLQFAHCQPNIIRVIKSAVYVKVGGEHYCYSEARAYAGLSVATGEFAQVGQFPAEEARQKKIQLQGGRENSLRVCEPPK